MDGKCHQRLAQTSIFATHKKNFLFGTEILKILIVSAGWHLSIIKLDQHLLPLAIDLISRSQGIFLFVSERKKINFQEVKKNFLILWDFLALKRALYVNDVTVNLV